MADLAVLTRSSDAPDGNAHLPPGVEWLSVADQSPDQMIGLVAEWGPSIVYTHGLGEPAFEAALAAAFPTVYYAHNYGGMCISGTKCKTFPSPIPCERTFGPACLGLYLPRRCGGLNPLEAVQQYNRERRRQRSFARFQAVLVASRHMAAEFVRNGTPADRVHLVPLPVAAPPDREPPPARLVSGRILFVGRLTALKGWPHLVAAILRAANSLGRPLTLVVAGDGPDRAKFEAAVGRAGVPAEFLGWVSAARRDAEMRNADLLAVPSVWPEPFGLVGVEAGCVGLPAVGYAVGGIPDWLIPGVSGELAPGERPDPRDLADAIARALSDAGHWQRLRVGAWETAKRFSPEAHLNALMPILESAART